MSSVGVVVPVYGNAPVLDALHARIRAAVGEELAEVVYVDDASPDDSLAVLGRLRASDPLVRVIARTENGGQQRALLDGLATARGDWLVTIDADLQDPPEAIPTLVRAGRAGSPVVFGAREGRYESAGRLLTSRAFKRIMAVLGGLPHGASSFAALRRDAVAAVLALDGDRPPFLTGMVAAAALPSATLPVHRAPSATGSSYRRRDRVGAGLRGLRWALAARRRSAEEHNRIQLAYYGRRESRSIAPLPTPYARRQVATAIGAARLRPGERVLDVGCGAGRATLLLSAAGLAVEGLELSPALLARLRPRAPGLPLHEGDLVAPPSELHGRFDAVAGFFVLHHMHDVAAALRGARTTLRPGGRAVFVEPNAFCPLFYAQVAAVPGMSFEADGGIVHMRAGLLQRAAFDAGFAQVRQHTFGLFPPFAANRPRGAALERRLEGLPGVAPVRAFRVLVAA
jgi:SAM-dependent methyltransferase